MANVKSVKSNDSTAFIYIIKTLLYNRQKWNWTDVVKQRISAIFVFYFVSFKKRKVRSKKSRTFCFRHIFTKREDCGSYNTLLQNLWMSDGW